jgi:predicted MPP superfamily phosphohydrolase
MDINKIKEEIIAFYKNNPQTELKAKDIAEKFGLDLGDREKTNKYVRDLKRVAFGTRHSLKSAFKSFVNELKNFKEDFSKGTLESTISIDFEPKSVEELYKEHKINPQFYVIKNYWSKKQPNGNFTSSVFAVKKTIETAEPKDFIELLKGYKSSYTPISNKNLCINEHFTRPTCVLLHLTDFHLDKLDIYGTTLEEKVEQFYEVTKRLMFRTYQSNYVEEIVFVLGSDMLHTDTYQGTTTNQTPQDSNTTWDNAFMTGFDVYATVINILKQFCKTLNVVLVSGNHARTKEFYLAYSLKRYFEKQEDILFDVSASPRKVFVYGNTFIGFHHGDCKIADLPLIFAKEFTSQWGMCKYHQILTGDKHHVYEKEVQGVRIKQLPSLSKEDAWHNQSNYVNAVQAAIAIVYDKEHGTCMTVEERI